MNHAERNFEPIEHEVVSRAYSEVDVLFDYLENPNSFKNKYMNILKGVYKEKLRIVVPSYFYLKVELVCNRFEKNLKKSFLQINLINKLLDRFLDDFLLDPFQAHKHLQSVRSTPSVINQLQLEEPSVLKDEEELYEEVAQGFQPLRIKIPRYRVLEIESLLRDMEEFFPQHIYTAERLVETIYVEFADNVMKGDAGHIIQEMFEELR